MTAEQRGRGTARARTAIPFNVIAGALGAPTTPAVRSSTMSLMYEQLAREQMRHARREVGDQVREQRLAVARHRAQRDRVRAVARRVRLALSA